MISALSHRLTFGTGVTRKESSPESSSESTTGFIAEANPPADRFERKRAYSPTGSLGSAPMSISSESDTEERIAAPEARPVKKARKTVTWSDKANGEPLPRLDASEQEQAAPTQDPAKMALLQQVKSPKSFVRALINSGVTDADELKKRVMERFPEKCKMKKGPGGKKEVLCPPISRSQIVSMVLEADLSNQAQLQKQALERNRTFTQPDKA